MICVTDSPNKAKQAESEEIAADIEAFLKRGGRIKQVQSGRHAHVISNAFSCVSCGTDQDRAIPHNRCKPCMKIYMRKKRAEYQQRRA